MCDDKMHEIRQRQRYPSISGDEDCCNSVKCAMRDSPTPLPPSRRIQIVIIKFKGHRDFLVPPESHTTESNQLSDNASMSAIFLFAHIYRVFSDILSRQGVCRLPIGNGIVIFLIFNIGRTMQTPQ